MFPLAHTSDGQTTGRRRTSVEGTYSRKSHLAVE
jgi:hypothetical protein